MNKMKVISFAWGILLVSLLLTLTVFGKKYLKTIEPYERLENKLANATETYVDEQLELNKGKYIIYSDDLIDKGYIENLNVENDKCTGYVVVKYKNNKEYTSYIKCSGYKTKGYKN